MSQQPNTMAASAPSHSDLSALSDLPDNVLLTVVQLLPLAGKRALRITCRCMCSFVDVHALHTLQLGADAEVALTELIVSPEAVEAWRAVQRRSYHHITCLTFTGCSEGFAHRFTVCVAQSLQHLQEVRIDGTADTTVAVLMALLGERSSDATGAICSSSAVCSIRNIRCKLDTVQYLFNEKLILQALGECSGLRSLHISGWAPSPSAAVHSFLSTLHALTSLAANVQPEVLTLWLGLQRLHVSRHVWDDYSPLSSLTALRSLTLPPLEAARVQQLAVCLPPTLTELKMLRLHGFDDFEQEMMEAWHHCSLARLNVPTLNLSCEVLSGLVSLTMLSCHSLNQRTPQGREVYSGLAATLNAAHGIHAPSTGRNTFTTAPSHTMHSLWELHLHDSGFRSGTLPRMCPALTHLSIHHSRGRVHPALHVCVATAQKLFGDGDLPKLQSLRLPEHLLTHEAVSVACASVTSFSCAGNHSFFSTDYMGRAARNIAAMQQLQQLSLHGIFSDDESKRSLSYVGNQLLQAAAMCTRLTEMELHGVGVCCSEHGLASLATAPALRVLKLSCIDPSVCTPRALELIADMDSLRYLEVECFDDAEAVKLAACVRRPTLEFVVHACKPFEDCAKDEFVETDHEDLDSYDDEEEEEEEVEEGISDEGISEGSQGMEDDNVDDMSVEGGNVDDDNDEEEVELVGE